jgi:hypothetical protein
LGHMPEPGQGILSQQLTVLLTAVLNGWQSPLDSYLSTSPQRAEKILDSRGGEFGPGLTIVLYRQAE